MSTPYQPSVRGAELNIKDAEENEVKPGIGGNLTLYVQIDITYSIARLSVPKTTTQASSLAR